MTRKGRVYTVVEELFPNSTSTPPTNNEEDFYPSNTTTKRNEQIKSYGTRNNKKELIKNLNQECHLEKETFQSQPIRNRNINSSHSSPPLAPIKQRQPVGRKSRLISNIHIKPKRNLLHNEDDETTNGDDDDYSPSMSPIDHKKNMLKTLGEY